MTWLMLVYKLPADRSTRRVYVWRRLKRIGAIYLQDGTCVLPMNDRTREQFQWLAAEIVEMAGEAYACSAEFLAGDQEARVVDQFREQSRVAYHQVRADLEQVAAHESDRVQMENALRDAWTAFGAARQIDFFAVPERDQTLGRLRAIAEQIEHSRWEGHE
ncbi:MAG: ChrB protein [Bacillota bacterium]|nr:ChrB protein [Bacillota bacterium]